IMINYLKKLIGLTLILSVCLFALSGALPQDGGKNNANGSGGDGGGGNGGGGYNVGVGNGNGGSGRGGNGNGGKAIGGNGGVRYTYYCRANCKDAWCCNQVAVYD
ncbi:hypothetical protein G9A89_009914, partial [Geosiphon pyriformis]